MPRLDTGDGHILVALIVFIVGVVMVYVQIDGGKEVVVGSLASLWTCLRNSGRRVSELQSSQTERSNQEDV